MADHVKTETVNGELRDLARASSKSLYDFNVVVDLFQKAILPADLYYFFFLNINLV